MESLPGVRTYPPLPGTQFEELVEASPTARVPSTADPPVGRGAPRKPRGGRRRNERRTVPFRRSRRARFNGEIPASRSPPGTEKRREKRFSGVSCGAPAAHGGAPPGARIVYGGASLRGLRNGA